MKVQEIKQLSEASLSRTYRFFLEHDGGIITAFRYAPECGTGKPYELHENMRRNDSLQSKLSNLGYGITRARGAYIENYGSDEAREVNEIVFIVIDLEDRGRLKNDLIRLGEEFEQDSILFVPKGAQMGLLIGTNKCPQNKHPGYGNTTQLKNPVFGRDGRFFTRVRGRPFVLEEGISYTPPARGFFGKWGTYLASKKNWRELPESDDDSILD